MAARHSSRGSKGRFEDTRHLKTQDTTIDRRARTQSVALHQDYGMHKEVEIDDLFKSTGTISTADGNESEQV